MRMNKDKMKNVISTAGYKVEEDNNVLIVRDRTDEFVISIPFASPTEEFESHFVNNILND